jgi:hypothetical protein
MLLREGVIAERLLDRRFHQFGGARFAPSFAPNICSLKPCGWTLPALIAIGAFNKPSPPLPWRLCSVSRICSRSAGKTTRSLHRSQTCAVVDRPRVFAEADDRPAANQQRQDRFKAIGHRIVHGGATFTTPVRIDDHVMEHLSKLEPLAPLHQPHNLSSIRICAALQPRVPQIACFDTAFHRTMDSVARRLGLPRDYEDEGVQRYGFHGLSYEYIANALRAIDPELANGRVIVAHLGNGASLCAMHADLNGRPLLPRRRRSIRAMPRVPVAQPA